MSGSLYIRRYKMGIFSGLFRYREAGEPLDIENLQEFGEPQYSLFSNSKVLSLRHEIDITDENGNVKYHSETKPFSLHDRTYITDEQGQDVAYVYRKVFSLHQRHFVEMADGLSFEMATELFHLIEDIMNIEGLAWQLRGNIMGLDFRLYDQNGDVAALITQKAVSLHDKYRIDIYQPDYEKVIVAILIALQHIMIDRASAAGSSSSSSSSK